jgi:integral membrane protein (TIGR01906 family)
MKRLASTGLLLVTIAVPFFLLMSSIRILLIPYLYLDFEYNTPGFPPDTYGFTLQDRLHWSKISMDYLLNDQGISWLADQKLADGSPLYTDRELSHMLDVKNLIQAMFVAWWIMLAAFIGIGLISWRLKGIKRYWKALSSGGWLTIGLIFAILIFVVISFNTLFTDFHRIFFSGNTWLFLFSDTLIRLFPMQFWQDAFIWMGVITNVFAVLIGYFGRRFAKSS